jgi:EpsI family protein
MNLRRRSAWLLAAAALMACTALAAQTARDVAALPLRAPLTALPRELGPWLAMGPDHGLDQRTLQLLQPQEHLLRNYLDAQGQVCALFVAYFGAQREGQMIHSPRQCLPGSGWQIKSRQEVVVPGPGGGRRVNHLVLALNLDRLSVLYWYQGRGRVEPNEYLDRLRLVSDSFLHGRSDGALVRLTAEIRPSGPEIAPGQVEMAAALIPALEHILPDSSGGRP